MEASGRVSRVQAFQRKARMRASSRKEQVRFVKFAVVGTIGAAVDFAVLNVLVLIVGLTPLAANPFSVAAAVVSNFTFNRFWSFPESRSRPVIPQFTQYALINVVGLLLNQGIMWAMLGLVIPSLPVAPPLDYNLAKATAILLVLFWNFGINRLTTYRGL